MNLYEYEGKQLFETVGIPTPRGVVVLREEVDQAQTKIVDLASSGVTELVVKAQVLSGKRGKNNGIKFCSSVEEAVAATNELFDTDIRGQHVAAVRIEEKLDIAAEHYLSITYDTAKKQPVLVYSAAGGVDIEDVPDEQIVRQHIAIAEEEPVFEVPAPIQEIAAKLWQCFKTNDARLVEINPLVETGSGEWIAADAKVALDDDAFYRHEEWGEFAPRTMMGRPPTDREVAVQAIDAGENYYRGTAGKYVEMDGDIAVLFSGGGASIANMDALNQHGLSAANYTEYSGNPPREKVYELTKIVLSKPNLRGLWIAGGVANFTNVEATFHGIVDALDEVKPAYPIVVRRAGPHDVAGMELMQACADRNGLTMTLLGKDVSMSESAKVLADLIQE